MFRVLFQGSAAYPYEGLAAPITGELNYGIIIAVILIVLFIAFITVKNMRRK